MEVLGWFIVEDLLRRELSR